MYGRFLQDSVFCNDRRVKVSCCETIICREVQGYLLSPPFSAESSNQGYKHKIVTFIYFSEEFLEVKENSLLFKMLRPSAMTIEG